MKVALWGGSGSSAKCSSSTSDWHSGKYREECHDKSNTEGFCDGIHSRSTTALSTLVGLAAASEQEGLEAEVADLPVEAEAGGDHRRLPRLHPPVELPVVEQLQPVTVLRVVGEVGEQRLVDVEDPGAGGGGGAGIGGGLPATRSRSER